MTRSSTKNRSARAAGSAVVAAIIAVHAHAAVTASDAPVRNKSLAESAFDSADTANKGYLDGRSLRTARRILRGALQRDARRSFPGGETSAATVFDFALLGNPDTDEDDRVTRDEFLAFGTQVMLHRNAALAHAQRRAEQRRQELIKAQQQRDKLLLQELLRSRRKKR